MLSLSQAASAIGAGVVYRPHEGRHEDGEIISANDHYVMVWYVGDRGPKATRPEDLLVLNHGKKPVDAALGEETP